MRSWGYVVSKLFCTIISPIPYMPPQLGARVFIALVTAFGAWVGYRGGPVARWSGCMAALLGLSGFAYGVAVASQGDLTLGVLVGLYVPGPFGAIVGGIIGAVVGLIRERRLRKNQRESVG